jgi:uncharacterized phage protein (TIGR02220 family)
MARMSIDDKFLRDPRVARLARALGWSRYEARGRLLDVFAVCYDLETDVLRAEDIDTAAEHPGLADEMFAVDLAVNVRGGLRIRGAGKRIEYLGAKREAGRLGGLKSGESRRLSAKHPRSNNEAPPNPPDPVPDLPPDPVPDPVPDQERRDLVAPHPARGRRAGKPASSPADHAVVMRILGKLGEHNGVRYGGAAQHVKLIAARLRDGLTEWQLRAVVAFCADEWKADEKMRKYLRPETLFGPESIAKYLDPACSRYRDLIAQHATQPTLALDGGKPR